MTSAARWTAARSAISKQSWKMHDEHFQIAFLLIYQCPWKRARIFPRLWADHVCYQTRRPNQIGLAFGGGTGVQANSSAMRAVRLARLDVVDRDPRRWLPGPRFRAAQSSRNGRGRLGQHFAEDPLPVLLVESDDAM